MAGFQGAHGYLSSACLCHYLSTTWRKLCRL
jgi:hypothetical protein